MPSRWDNKSFKRQRREEDGPSSSASSLSAAMDAAADIIAADKNKNDDDGTPSTQGNSTNPHRNYNHSTMGGRRSNGWGSHYLQHQQWSQQQERRVGGGETFRHDGPFRRQQPQQRPQKYRRRPPYQESDNRNFHRRHRRHRQERNRHNKRPFASRWQPPPPPPSLPPSSSRRSPTPLLGQRRRHSEREETQQQQQQEENMADAPLPAAIRSSDNGSNQEQSQTVQQEANTVFRSGSKSNSRSSPDGRPTEEVASPTVVKTEPDVQSGPVTASETTHGSNRRHNNDDMQQPTIENNSTSNSGSSDDNNCPFFKESDGDPMAFCCANCKCTPEKREEYGDEISYAAPNDYCHRHCCHRIKKKEVPETWLPPLEELRDRMQARQLECLENGQSYPKPKPTVISRSQFMSLARTTRQVEYDDDLENPIDLLSTNPQYIANQQQFAKEVEERQNDLRPAVVLDMFAGIGAAMVVLKRLGIAISKAIHVEHDKIAEHVIRCNHADDGIEHLYFSKFEDVESNINQILDDHGPIDIIIGGPPCTDYTSINAYHQGPQGRQGQFLPRFCDLIQTIQRRQPNHPVYHLIENVVFTDANREDNYDLIQSKIGVVETKQDALYLSPCKRFRSYWLNFPLRDFTSGHEEASKIRPSSCLEDDWIFPGEDEAEGDETVCVKANTFLASKGRINDGDRMAKARPINGRSERYEKGHLSALERERMLGFPDGYVKDAVEHLFEELFTNALALRFPDEAKEKRLWTKELDPRYFCFSGEEVKYEEVYDEENETPSVQILMSPPQVTQCRDFFNAEDYSKHLLGNSFTVPGVEYLLSRLREVFASRKYEGYDYDYCWNKDAPRL